LIVNKLLSLSPDLAPADQGRVGVTALGTTLDNSRTTHEQLTNNGGSRLLQTEEKAANVLYAPNSRNL